MIKSVSEFFKNLPNKSCTKCGAVIEEQADCYTSTCNECNDFSTYKIHN